MINVNKLTNKFPVFFPYSFNASSKLAIDEKIKEKETDIFLTSKIRPDVRDLPNNSSYLSRGAAQSRRNLKSTKTI